jgi:FG-GAP-like repeat
MQPQANHSGHGRGHPWPWQERRRQTGSAKGEARVGPRSRNAALAVALAALVSWPGAPAAAAPAAPPAGTGAGTMSVGSLRSDIDGDGRDDVISFERSSFGTVYVATSNGTSFQGNNRVWHRDFAFDFELPLVGDFNGDGLYDVATFHRGGSGDVYVATSTGAGFSGTGRLWNGDAVFFNELPVVGDFNGDGRDDVVAFTRGSAGDVFVSLNSGSVLSPRQRWHGDFSFREEIPGVGDFNGDGRDDILTFLRGGDGDIYVALSDGIAFRGTGLNWNRNFAFHDELPQPTCIIGPIVF